MYIFLNDPPIVPFAPLEKPAHLFQIREHDNSSPPVGIFTRFTDPYLLLIFIIWDRIFIVELFELFIFHHPWLHAEVESDGKHTTKWVLFNLLFFLLIFIKL